MTETDQDITQTMREGLHLAPPHRRWHTSVIKALRARTIPSCSDLRERLTGIKRRGQTVRAQQRHQLPARITDWDSHHMTIDATTWWQCRECMAVRPKNVAVGWMLDLKDKTCRCPSCDDAAWSKDRGPAATPSRSRLLGIVRPLSPISRR